MAAKRTPAKNVAMPAKPGAALPADLIATAEAAELKGLSPRTLTQHAIRGHVPGAVKLGGENGIWMFSRAAIVGWTPARRGRPSEG